MAIRPHLVLQEAKLFAGADWRPESTGWVFAQATKGISYWIGGGKTCEVKPGMVFCAPPGLKAALRVSVLSAELLHWFAIDPNELVGVVSYRERKLIDSAAHSDVARWVYPADSETAKTFEQILRVPSNQLLRRRVRMIELFFSVVASHQGAVQTDKQLDARGRIHEVLAGIPENQLLHITLPELARELNCSERHVSRMFREEIGVTFRSKQKELRLEKARHMLVSSDEKILNIALECGYRHLGLFSVLFKRRFKVTPSEMRRRSQEGGDATRAVARGSKASKLAGTLRLVALLMPLIGCIVLAEERVETPVAGGKVEKLKVASYDVDGNTLLPKETVDRVLSAYTGDSVSPDTVMKGLAALQLEYRDRGWVTVTVNLPEQTPTNGVIRVKVIEGRVTEILVTGNKHYGSNNVIRAMGGIRTNEPLNSKVFQAQLDAANANRDRQIFPKVQPGQEFGGTTLVLEVKDRFPLHSRFELNNQGTPGTPELRGLASAEYDNLWDREHVLGFQYSFALQQMKTQDVPLYRALDIPAIANYSAFYRLPLGGVTSIPEQLAARPNRFGYDETTRQFRLPPASGRSELNFFASRSTTDTGVQFSEQKEVAKPPFAIFSQDSGQDLSENESAGVRLSIPMSISKGWRSTLSLGVDLKHFALQSFNTNNFLFRSEIPPEVPGFPPTIVETTQASPQPVRRNEVNYLPWTVQQEFVRSDRTGVTSMRVGLSANLAGGPFSSGNAFHGPAGSTNASGSYVVGQGSISRDQKIHGEWSVLLRADGQWASEPLISNEQFAIGGLAGPRGYMEAERFGDHGARFIIEPRLPTIDMGLVDERLPLRLKFSVFNDVGVSELIDPNGRRGSITMWSIGIAAAASIGTHFDFRTSVGWPLLSGPITQAGNARVYFGLSAQF